MSLSITDDLQQEIEMVMRLQVGLQT
jgi:hypothetical protein